MRLKPLCKYEIVGLSVAVALALVACSDSGTKVAAGGPGLEEAARVATEAYIYSYPLVTMDMTRKQLTNVTMASGSRGHL